MLSIILLTTVILKYYNLIKYNFKNKLYLEITVVTLIYYNLIKYYLENIAVN